MCPCTLLRAFFCATKTPHFPCAERWRFQPRFLNVYYVISAAFRILQILPALVMPTGSAANYVISAAFRILQILPALVMPTGSAARRPDLFLRHRVVPSENLIYCPAVLPRISVNSSANIAFIFESGLEFHPQIESVLGTDERALIHRPDISKIFCIFATTPRQNSIWYEISYQESSSCLLHGSISGRSLGTAGKGLSRGKHLIRNLIPTVHETSLRFEYKKICKFYF